MNPKKSLAKNTVLIALSKVSTQLITFLMLPIYTSILSTGEYGTVDLIVTYASLFAPLAMLNMEMAVFRHLIDARDNEEAKRRVVTNAVEIIVVSSLCVALVFLIIGCFIDSPIIAIAVFYFFSVGFSSIVVQIARGLGKIKAYAITSIAKGVLGVILNVLFLLVLDMGPEGMLLGLGVGMSLPAMVLAVVIRLHKNVKTSSRDRSMKKDLLKYSLPLIPNSISLWTLNASDRTIISILLGIAANGIYAVSNKFSGVLSTLWGIFYMSWSESASLNINKPNRDALFSEIANISIRAFGAMAILGISLTPLAFPLLANESFGEALNYVPILMLGSLFSIVVGFYSTIYVAKKLTRQVMNTSIAAALINIVVHMILVWFIGLWAAAISTAVAFGVMALYRHLDMKKYVRITYERGVFVKIFAVFAVVCVLYYMNNIWASLAGVVVAVVASLWLNWGLIQKVMRGGKVWVVAHGAKGRKR